MFFFTKLEKMTKRDEGQLIIPGYDAVFTSRPVSGLTAGEGRRPTKRGTGYNLAPAELVKPQGNCGTLRDSNIHPLTQSQQVKGRTKE